MNQLTTINKLLESYKDAKVTGFEILTSGGKYLNNLDYFYKHADNELIDNLAHLLKIINIVRQKVARPFVINSGFRTPEHNQKVGGVKKSNHCLCLAVDLKDPDGQLDNIFYIHKNQLLKQYKASIESPRYTKGWCHFQACLPASGKEIFKPYTREPLTQEYDESFKFLKDYGL